MSTSVTITRPANIPATVSAQRIEAWLLARGVAIIDVRWLGDAALVVTSDDGGVPALNLEAFNAAGDDGRSSEDRAERSDFVALNAALATIRAVPANVRTPEQRAILNLAQIVGRRMRLGEER